MEPGGVLGSARAQGWMRNTGDPSGPPVMRQGCSYKPMAKANGVQRESEGVVVPLMGVKQNAPGGKGLCFGHAVRRGKREGMVRASGPNFPSGSHSTAKCENSESGSMRTPSVLEERRMCMQPMKTIGKPCAGKPQARFERGAQETGGGAPTGP